MARGPDQRRKLKKDYEPGRTNIQTAQSLQKFLHTYSVGVNARLKGKFEQAISPDTGRNNTIYLEYNIGDFRVVKQRVQ